MRFLKAIKRLSPVRLAKFIAAVTFDLSSMGLQAVKRQAEGTVYASGVRHLIARQRSALNVAVELIQMPVVEVGLPKRYTSRGRDALLRSGSGAAGRLSKCC